MALRNHVADRFRSVFHRFGYDEIATPTFESLELFTAKSGDGIIKELYNFQDKGKREMTLRPELTAPTMRMYFGDHQMDPKPVKWFYFANCFRYDRPQEGRYREFWQFGCEQMGAGTPLAYAELIALADGLFEEVGLKERELFVGHVKILKSAVDQFGLADDKRGELMRAIDKRDNAAIAAIVPDAAALIALMDARTLADAKAAFDADYSELEETLSLLQSFGVESILNLGIARGLDYYNGVVFEAHCPILGGQKQVLGGGGYDLSALFGANPTPTMGFGLGFDRTIVALEKQGDLPEVDNQIHVYFGAMSDGAREVCILTATKLRSKGVSCEIDLLGRKGAKIAKAADGANARFLVILGDRDIESGVCKVKHLATGDQTEVAIANLVSWLQQTSGRPDFKDFD
jgi:histidyl-tRNA synthetase